MLLSREQRVWLEVTLPWAVPTLLQPRPPAVWAAPDFWEGRVSRDALRADLHLQGPVLSMLPFPSSILQELSMQTKSSDSRQLQRAREPAGRAWQRSLPDFQVKGNK